MTMIHPAHENFNMVFNIMLGIQRSLDGTLDLSNFEPKQKDFAQRSIHQVAPPSNINPIDLEKACTFFDYAPQVFAAIRRSSGIRKERYGKALGPEQVLGYVFSGKFKMYREIGSSGKSGSFFYYSSDGEFMLKTIKRDEFKLMKAILPKYYQYLTKDNPSTLISRIYGLHKVIFNKRNQQYDKKVYFCVMNNVFQNANQIDYRYDLKGSTQGRQTVVAKKNVNLDPSIALKDLDFIKRKESIDVPDDLTTAIIKIMKKDSAFLRSNSIIDYSLLVGVHLVKDKNQQRSWQAHSSHQ